MSRRRSEIAGLVALGLVLASAAHAQAPLSLATAQAEARANAPQAAELSARIVGAQAIAAQVGRRFREDPTLSGTFFHGAVLGRPDESVWSVSIQQAFDFSGSWKSRAASSSADLERTRQEREDGLRALDERVAMAFADVALAQQQRSRAGRIADLQRITADAVRRQFQVGDAPQIDADSADLDLAGALASVDQAEGELDRSRAQLARLIGRNTAGDFLVDDAQEGIELPASAPDFAPLVERDPRVRAVAAELEAATFEREMTDRLMSPPVTFGLEFARQRRDIPVASFTGVPFASGLAANWTDAELIFTASLPLPVLNRQREPRARATARVLAAQARLRVVRADVRSEVESSWMALAAATRAVQRLGTVTTIIERDVTFVEQAVAAGAFDAVTRTVALRRLQDAGRGVDAAVRNLRVARAAWIRRSAL